MLNMSTMVGPRNTEGDERPWPALYSPGVPADFTPASRNGVELFARAVREHPDDVAMFYFDARISFAEADAEAHALAILFRELGVGEGDCIALMMQNVPHFPTAMHATWLLGAHVTAINVMNKRRELVHQLSDAEAKVVVCLESLRPRIEEAVPETLVEHVITVSAHDFLADDAPAPAALTDEPVPNPSGAALVWSEVVSARLGERVDPASPDPDSAAMITYTSGTTGQPKGAINSHGNVVYDSEVYVRWFSLGEGDVTVAIAPLFHITGLIAHVGAARAAGTPLLLAYRFDPAELLRLIELRRGTFLMGAITAFIALGESPDIGERDLSSIAKVASGGAPVSPTVIERFERATGAYIHNVYGLTETTSPTHAVPYGARGPVDADSGAVSVGVPVCGADCKIVDSADPMVELELGGVGEILVRGPMVVSGYWNRPEANEVAFVDGWFRTGDVGKRDVDGWFWVVDRVKDMINCAGYKVWPRDVEDFLHQHPAVSEAAVVGIPDDYRGESVLAYLVLRAGESTSEEQVIAHCRAGLANYKVPRRVVFLEELPKTATGKVLRRELRAAASSAYS
jgi:long-chain acyl-CoA synthetase